MTETLPAPEARPPRAVSPARDGVKPKKPTRRAIMIAVVGLLLVAAPWVAHWCLVRAVGVPIAVATPGAIAARLVGPGTVPARMPVTLSARVGATLMQVHADVGDAVHPGQPLVTLGDRDPSARRDVVAGQQEALLRDPEGARPALDRSQADLELARSRQRRDAELLAKGFVAQTVLDASNSGRDGAAAGVDAARVALAALAARAAEARSLSQEAHCAETVLSYTRIVSPMDRVVIQRLGEVGNSLPAQLSCGAQRRVAIDRALPNDPVLTLADEPTAALDTQRGTKVMPMLRQIAHERRSAVIAVTHDHRMIEGFDTVYHLEEGRLARVDHHAQSADPSPA